MPKLDPDKFVFHNLNPYIRIGTASDRYAGWIGQIYTEGKYKTTSRSNKVGGKSFKEEVLPVESVREYFQHFSVLEIDYTFYRPLLDADLKPTTNYHVLETYKKFLGRDDRLILKVPQAVFAHRIRRGGAFIENPDYLNAEKFTRQFYEPANDILGDLIVGFVFEQEYQPKKDRHLFYHQPIIRHPSATCRIRGMDNGTEEHFVRGLFPFRRDGVFEIR